jgi:steroid delta-isomerase-like uncharacterized protein
MSKEKSIVRRLVEEAQGKGNLAVVDELLADDFVDHSAMPGLPPTRDGVRILFGALRAAFPDLDVTIHEQIGEGEKVVTRKTFSGTHRGAFMGAEPTGNRVTFEVIDILTVRDDKIHEHRLQFDQLSLLKQLGAL